MRTPSTTNDIATAVAGIILLLALGEYTSQWRVRPALAGVGAYAESSQYSYAAADPNAIDRARGGQLSTGADCEALPDLISRCNRLVAPRPRRSQPLLLERLLHSLSRH